MVTTDCGPLRGHQGGAAPAGRPPTCLVALALALALLLLVASVQPVAAGVSRPGSDPRLPRAAAWASRRVDGPTLWFADGDTLCGRFVERAYGVAGLRDAPPGALVFFAPTARNGGSGHVGIYVVGGQFIGVGTGGHVRRHDVGWYNDAIARYLGWGYPPVGWPGSTG
ncbi:MAG: C40 family peptidase [Chloroflexota bacterium]|nr:C40 family peptidase [Chloroflexota bacterium]